MFSTRVYRALLAAYPREFRREYGDLMVQFFTDRMRYDGGGLRGLILWWQLIFGSSGGIEQSLRRVGAIIMSPDEWDGVTVSTTCVDVARGNPPTGLDQLPEEERRFAQEQVDSRA